MAAVTWDHSVWSIKTGTVRIYDCFISPKTLIHRLELYKNHSFIFSEYLKMESYDYNFQQG